MGLAAFTPALPARRVRAMLATVTQSRNSKNTGPNSASRNIPLTQQAGAVSAASNPIQRGRTRVFRITTTTAAIMTPIGSKVTMKATLFILCKASCS